MSDGTLDFPKRATAPETPAAGRYKIWVDSVDDEAKFTLDSGTTKTFKGDKGDQGDTGPQGIQGIQGPVGPQGPMKVEGFVSETSTLTLPNTDTFQQIYTHSIAVTADGPMYVDVSLTVRPHSTGNDVKFRLEFDGNALLPEYAEEHKDSGADEGVWRSQCLSLGNVTAGTYDLDLYFAKENTGGTAQLKNYTAKVVRY